MFNEGVCTGVLVSMNSLCTTTCLEVSKNLGKNKGKETLVLDIEKGNTIS